MDISSILQKNIKQLRLENNLTQDKLASLIGIRTVYYSRYETGARQIPYDVLLKLADFYDVSLDEIFERNEKYYR